MARRLRFIPPERTLVEITTRTLHGRFLLKPSRRVREMTLGVLGRAQRRCGVVIHAFVFLSNHYHLLISVDNAKQMAQFTGYLNSNLAREIARLTGWREKIWGRRYVHIITSQEEAAQVGRLRYLLAQGVKEGLVEHPARWRGAQCVNALLDGRTLRGIWYDRTRQYRARLRGETVRRQDFASFEQVILSPLPCWLSLSEALRRRGIRALIDSILEEDGKREHGKRQPNRLPLSKLKVTDRPRHSKRSPAPWFHCASKTERLRLKMAYFAFLKAYRHAAERWCSGDLSVQFPDGCFPPPRPFLLPA